LTDALAIIDVLGVFFLTNGYERGAAHLRCISFFAAPIPRPPPR